MLFLLRWVLSMSYWTFFSLLCHLLYYTPGHQASTFNPLSPKIKKLNSHFLSLFISYRSSGKKLIKYQVNSSCVIMSVILMTTLFYKALILQGETLCWSLLGLKKLRYMWGGWWRLRLYECGNSNEICTRDKDFFYSYYSPRGNKLRNVVNLNFDRKTVFFIRVFTPQQIL